MNCTTANPTIRRCNCDVNREKLAVTERVNDGGDLLGYTVEGDGDTAILDWNIAACSVCLPLGAMKDETKWSGNCHHFLAAYDFRRWLWGTHRRVRVTSGIYTALVDLRAYTSPVRDQGQEISITGWK